MIETKTGETSFATGVQENKKNERFWKIARTKNKNTGLGHWKTWHINKQTTELQHGDPKKIEHIPRKAGQSKKTNGRPLFGLAL